MTTTNSTTQTFTRAQIESIVEQIKAITIDGTPVFEVSQDEELETVYVRITAGCCAAYVDFVLDPSDC